jgi:DMSO/TMAO reductase YedYZ molybdopterin-dependent catalytic subunit
MSTNSDSKIYLPRRRFLQISGLSSLGLMIGGCGTSLYDDLAFKTTEPLNQTVEALLLNPYKLTPEFPGSAIEPKALLINTFDFTPKINPEKFLLKVDGDVERTLSLSMAQIKAMPLTSMTIRHICVEGWSAIVQWAGIQLRYIVSLAKPSKNVRYINFKSADGYYESWDLVSALHPQTILAYQKNGQPIPIDNGAPLRLASPIKLGYKQSKWITQISLLSEKPKALGYWEDQGYEWFGGL